MNANSNSNRTRRPRLCHVSAGMLFAILACTCALAQTPADEVLESIARSVPGRFGMAAVVIESGATLRFDADGRFPMQSVYKLPIAMAVLRQVELQALSLGRRVPVAATDLVPARQPSAIRDHFATAKVFTVGELLRAMVVESDGTACDVLLRLVGGPRKVTAYLREIGVWDVIVATTEQEMSRDDQAQYNNWATPRGMVELLVAFQKGVGLTRSSSDLLRGMLIETKTGPRRIKGLLPPKTIVAHKTGTSATVAGLTRATNDVGIVELGDGRHLAIAVFIADSTAGEAAREQMIARGAQLAWEALAR